MGASRITLVTSSFRDGRADLLILEQLEEACLRSGEWDSRRGPVLFAPIKVSSRFYTLLHDCIRPLARRIQTDRTVLSLGLPYRHYFFGKTFPYFTVGSRLRVFWTYDAWPARWPDILRIVNEARINLLLVSSSQAAQELRPLLPPHCEIDWVPEVVDVSRFRAKPWQQRTIDVLAFGRSFARYHEKIAPQCHSRGLRYIHDRFTTTESFIDALSASRICICFPRAVTHPESAGPISTVTMRYLESMAAKCLIVGHAPPEAEIMFGYNPVVEVNWDDSAGQLEFIINNPSRYTDLIERNFAIVSQRYQPRNFVERINALVSARLAAQRQ